MALQTFTAGQVLTAAQVTALQSNDFNQTVSTKTADYTLVAADKGTRVEMNSGSATTITVDTDLFNAGDTLFIQNIGAGVCTITAGTATVSTAGTLALAEFQGGTLYFVSTGVAIFFLTGSAGGGSALLSDSTISGTTGSPATATFIDDGVTFKVYLFKGSGSITFTQSGLVGYLSVGGGGGGGRNGNTGTGSTDGSSGGGGGGGVIQSAQFSVEAKAYTITIGAGGVAQNGTANGNNGNITSVDSFETKAGGGGGGFNVAGNTGANGGGGTGTSSTTSGGAGLSFNGGSGFGSATHSLRSGGGGGGAGGNGVAGTSSKGGDGGIGTTSTLIDTTTASGQNVGQVSGSDIYFAGGGGGGAESTSAGSFGDGGLGGGGAGMNTGGASVAGLANSGGGGGGGAGGTGQAGGSGLVIIKVVA